MTKIYTINNYTNTYLSYLQSIIPYNDRTEFIKFIINFYVKHGNIQGILKQLAATITPKIQLYTSNKLMENYIKNEIIKKKNIYDLFFNSILSALLFGEVAILYFPKQSLKLQCPHCGEIYEIDKNYKYEFRLVETAAINPKYKEVMNNVSVPYEERKLITPPVGIESVCPKCGTKFVQEPLIQNHNEELGDFVLLDVFLTRIYTNDAGKKFLYIDASNYDGPLGLHTYLNYMNIDGLPWDIIVGLAKRSPSIVINDPDQYYILSFNDIPGVFGGLSISGLLAALPDLISMDIMKLGLEAVSLSKIDPLYLITPINSVAGPEMEYIPHSTISDFILKSVKEYEEGSISRVVYTPAPVNAIPLFADSKRYISLQELAFFMSNIYSALGIPPQYSQQGLSVLVSDPVTLKIIDTLFVDKIVNVFERIVEYAIIRKYSYEYSKEKTSGNKVFGFRTIKLIDGSAGWNMYTELALQGKAPMELIYENLGIGTLKENTIQVMEEQLEQQKITTEYQYKMDAMQRQIRLEQQKQQEEQGQVDLTFAKQELMAQAQQIAEQLLSMDVGEQRSQLDELKFQDEVLYSIVRTVLERYKQKMETQAKHVGQEVINNGGGY